jgi:metallo-beta-lactamase family protein
MDIKFLGAAQTVTGSKHLIKTASGTKFLLDCGLFQGSGAETEIKNRNLNFNPVDLDFVILSHAHIDHSGNLPTIVKAGFRGKIYTTQATIDLCKIMLLDSAKIHQLDLKYVNRRRRNTGRELLEAVYDEKDVEETIKLFEPIVLGKWTKLSDDVKVFFTDAGHILGSVVTNLKIKENNKYLKLSYTGDIGRYDDRILKAPAEFPQADYIICESTYGNRLHPKTQDAEEELLQIIINTCIRNKGKIIIPAFSLGRTQEIVYAMDRLTTQGRMPRIDVYVDSPLSVNATAVMKKHPEFYNKNIIDYMKKDPDPFGFSLLHYVKEVEESKSINLLPDPCIIVSASGMAEAGRIKHHIKNNISDPKNTILMVGYCSPGSLGARLINGDKKIKIFGEEYKVLADVKVLSNYSAHADYLEIEKFLECQNPKKVKKVFLVHGEKSVQLDFKEFLHQKDFKDIFIPMEGESFTL